MLALAQKICGKRIYLCKHEKTISHAEEMWNLVHVSLREIKPWLDWATDDYSIEDAYEYMAFVDGLWEKSEGYTYAICMSDGTIIGNISLQNVSKKPEFAGNGYMQEAVDILEKEAFGKGLHKIIIRTDVLNLKSANVAIKRGYVLDGIMREDMYVEREQRYRDMNVFSKINKQEI